MRQREQTSEATCAAEERLRTRLRKLRWATGLRCPSCLGLRVVRHGRLACGQQRFRCGSCLRVFRDFSGTVFERSKMALGMTCRKTHRAVRRFRDFVWAGSSFEEALVRMTAGHRASPANGSYRSFDFSRGMGEMKAQGNHAGRKRLVRRRGRVPW